MSVWTVQVTPSTKRIAARYRAMKMLSSSAAALFTATPVWGLPFL